MKYIWLPITAVKWFGLKAKTWWLQAKAAKIQRNAPDVKIVGPYHP